MFDTGIPFMIGASPYLGGIVPFMGSLDEPELSQSTRSPDYIRAQYASEVPGNTFLTVGSEVAAPKPNNSLFMGSEI
jgi:hypothetical protein